MQVPGEKAWRLWLPFLVLVFIILAVSWLLPGVISPAHIRAKDEGLPRADSSSAVRSDVIDSKSAVSDAVKPLAGESEETLTLVPTKIVNCTYTRHYWREHPDSWGFENVIIASLSFTKSEALDIFSNEIQSGMEEAGSTRLLQEFFAALLNTLKGAEANAIEASLLEASDWLSAHPEGVELSKTQSNQALYLVEVLSEYNNGWTGPPHCLDEPPTVMPASSMPQTVTRTPTPRPGIGMDPSATPTAHGSAGGGGGQTKTPTPTDTPLPNTPGNTPPTATQSPSPEPTTPADTQTPSPEPTPPAPTRTPSPEPTAAPSSTSTLPPTATMWPSDTPLPEPSDTPEPPPPPTATEPGEECSPAYPDLCIPPPPPDLDCADIPQKNFTVLPPDPHNFDGDGDGIGCEG